MKPNQNILRAAGKLRGVWIFLVILQLLLTAVVYVVMGNYAAVFGWNAGLARMVVLAVIGFGLILQSVYFLSRIRRTKSLAFVEPVECTVEDIVIHSYIRDKKREYKAYLLVVDPKSGKRYFSYGNHCLSFYNYTVTGANRSLVDLQIFRKDGSVVKLGDRAYLFIRRPVQVKVSTGKNGILRLNGKDFNFQNVGKTDGKKLFSGVTFVEAAVDVEPQ